MMDRLACAKSMLKLIFIVIQPRRLSHKHPTSRRYLSLLSEHQENTRSFCQFANKFFDYDHFTAQVDKNTPSLERLEKYI